MYGFLKRIDRALELSLRTMRRAAPAVFLSTAVVVLFAFALKFAGFRGVGYPFFEQGGDFWLGLTVEIAGIAIELALILFILNLTLNRLNKLATSYEIEDAELLIMNDIEINQAVTREYLKSALRRIKRDCSAAEFRVINSSFLKKMQYISGRFDYITKNISKNNKLESDFFNFLIARQRIFDAVFVGELLDTTMYDLIENSHMDLKEQFIMCLQFEQDISNSIEICISCLNQYLDKPIKYDRLSVFGNRENFKDLFDAGELIVTCREMRNRGQSVPYFDEVVGFLESMQQAAK